MFFCLITIAIISVCVWSFHYVVYSILLVFILVSAKQFSITWTHTCTHTYTHIHTVTKLTHLNTAITMNTTRIRASNVAVAAPPAKQIIITLCTCPSDIGDGVVEDVATAVFVVVVLHLHESMHEKSSNFDKIIKSK